ncbi:MAG: hypothetical protein IPK26_16460 [Planctomycetes bacterium]|nr:hypothetical protein [Planctomycetota bacterium]
MPAHLLLVFFVAGLLHCQEPASPTPTPEQLLQQKLAQPFLQRATWTLDWDVARQRAAADGKLILGYFTTAGY